MKPGDAISTFKMRRRVTSGQAEALDRLLPAWAAPATGPLVAAELFGRRAPLVVEIGSGMGEATAAMAAADPDRDLLAVEVHTPGIAALLRRVEDLALTNVRVAEADAVRLVSERLAEASVDEVRVFFPDPWPKARHAKRRLVGPAFARAVARVLRPAGRWHVATDWDAYAAQVLDVLAASPDFDVVGRDRGDRPLTRFEQRGHAAGRASHDVVAVRRPRSPVRQQGA